MGKNQRCKVCGEINSVSTHSCRKCGKQLHQKEIKQHYEQRSVSKVRISNPRTTNK